MKGKDVGEREILGDFAATESKNILKQLLLVKVFSVQTYLICPGHNYVSNLIRHNFLRLRHNGSVGRKS